MNDSLFTKLLIAYLTITNTVKLNIAQAQAQVSKNVYSCINNKGLPTTVVDTNRGRIELIVWQSNYFRASGWNPQKRCQEVALRFQKFSDNSTLKYVTTGTINNQKVICIGKNFPGGSFDCLSDGLLITLEPNDNPDEVLKNLFTHATRVVGNPVKRDPRGKYVFPLNQYLEKAPIMEQNVVREENPQMTPVERETNNSQSID
jgi:hypothetical protein